MLVCIFRKYIIVFVLVVALLPLLDGAFHKAQFFINEEVIIVVVIVIIRVVRRILNLWTTQSFCLTTSLIIKRCGR